MITYLFYRMKHSNITYDAATNKTLIDNSLIKALETRKNRLKYNKEIKIDKKSMFKSVSTYKPSGIIYNEDLLKPN